MLAPSLPLVARLMIFIYVHEPVDTLDIRNVIRNLVFEASLLPFLDVGGPNDEPVLVPKLLISYNMLETWRRLGGVWKSDHQRREPRRGLPFPRQLNTDNLVNLFFAINVI